MGNVFETGNAATIGAGCHDSHNTSSLSTLPNLLLMLRKIQINKSGIVIAKT